MKILKKYPNRKIYDSSEKRHVTISDISDMVKNYEALQVVDSKTGEDITRTILLQIIADLEDGAKTSLLTNYMLENLIRMYDDPMGSMLAAYLDQSLKAFLQQKRSFKEQFDSQIHATQEETIEQFNQQYLDYYKKLFPYSPPE